MTVDTSSSVLSNLSVVDLTQGMAGSMVTMILGDNGADVVKIEPPGGDWSRRQPAFLMWNRGKRSVVLDLKDPDDRRRAFALASRADVVVESFRPGVVERLGLGYEAVAAANPRIVYCSLSGFGRLSEFSHVKGYESVVAARLGRMTGLDETEGAAKGQSLDRPIYLSVPLNSYAAAQLALHGIGSALLQRGDDGVGEHVMTSLLQGATATVMHQQMGKSTRRRDWSADLRYRGRKLTFLTAECKDGKFIQMCARMDNHFKNWMLATGLDDVLTDPRYAAAPLGIETLEALTELEDRIRVRMKERTQAEWMHTFIEEFDVGADPFLTPAEFLDHPQLLANNRVLELDDPVVGKVRQLGALVAFSDTPSRISASAPALGADTEAVIAGLSDPQQVAIRPEPIVAPGPLRKAPLAGVTILELAYFLAAPMGPTLMAELGARVIKIEPPGGDPWRRMGLEGAHTFHGKESIQLDLKTPASRQVLHDLIAAADVLVTNFRPDVPPKLGFDYPTAHSINDQLIYIYAASYGSKGPQSHRPAFHSTPNALGGGGILQAGLGNAPVDDGFPDPSAALAVGTAVVLGLLGRARTGKGQYLETNMLVSAGYVLSSDLVLYDGAPGWRLPDHGQHGPHALSRLYPCATGWLFVAAVREEEWVALTGALRRPDWLVDPRFETETARRSNDGPLIAEMGSVFATDSSVNWERRLAEADVSAAIADESDLATFLINHGLVDSAQHPEIGEYWRMQPRVSLANSAVVSGPYFSVGEHNVAILRGLGYDPAEIDDLVRQGAVIPPA